MDFLSPNRLQITPEEHAALVKVLEHLEAGKLKHVRDIDDVAPNGFNMMIWGDCNCGTPACIGGWAERLSPGVKFGHSWKLPPDLQTLFYPGGYTDYAGITTDQAAIALRRYLTIGAPHWSSIRGLARTD